MTLLLTFSDVHRYEPDDWSASGDRFTTDTNLDALQNLLDEGRILIAEHWHYRGARAPDRVVVEYYDDFIDYLKRAAIAGDIIEIFDITDLWKSRGSPRISGKCPDEKGEVPKSGAY